MRVELAPHDRVEITFYPGTGIFSVTQAEALRLAVWIQELCAPDAAMRDGEPIEHQQCGKMGVTYV